jgi:hypothetical protein
MVNNGDITMNYERIYNQIIERAKNRILVGYKETHHIIPRCMGGTNEKDNLVDLTAREHFMCHLLLTRIHPTHKGLRLAIWNMCNTKRSYQGRYKPNGRLYEMIRTEYREHIKGENHPSYGRKNSDEVKQKMSEIAKERFKNNSGTFKGRTHSEETRKKLSDNMKGKAQSNHQKERVKESLTGTKWYHKPDGTNLRAFPNDPKIIEEGWLHGRFGGKSISDKANKVKEKKYEGKKLPSTSNKRCSIDGVEFESAKAAADFLNINEFSIRWILQGRGRSEKHKEKYKNWFYIK